MNDIQMRSKIDALLQSMEVESLEERIAPVDCAKKPEHPDCQVVVKYGGPMPLYGVEVER